MKQLGEDNDLDLPEEENQAQISAFEPVTTFLDKSDLSLKFSTNKLTF